MNPMDLRRGINLAVEHVLADLKKRAKMISTTEEIAQVTQPAFVLLWPMSPHITLHASNHTRVSVWLE